jgi:hypothetical protein
MRMFPVLAIALLSAGCSSLPLGQSLPDYSGIKNVQDSDRAATYDRLKVSQVKDNLVEIGGNWYRVHNLKEICADLKYSDARHMASAAMAKNIAWDVAPPVTLGLGSFFGLYVGLLSTLGSAAQHSQTLNGTTTVSTNTNSEENAYIYQGAIYGTAVGLLLAGIEYGILGDSTSAKLAKAAALFNQDLRSDLNFVLSPQPGGAKAGVSKSF